MSPPQKERRPEDAAPERHSEDSAVAKPLELFGTHSRAASPPVATQLRRRRAAAVRCEPLSSDGRRDPLDPEASRDRWTGSRTLHVEEGSRNTAWLHGGRLKRLCERANVPHLWCHETRTWKVSRKRLGDLLAYARQVEGRFVTTELVDR